MLLLSNFEANKLNQLNNFDNIALLFIKRQKKRSKYLVLGPCAQKNFSVIESYTTATLKHLFKTEYKKKN